MTRNLANFHLSRLVDAADSTALAPSIPRSLASRSIASCSTTASFLSQDCASVQKIFESRSCRRLPGSFVVNVYLTTSLVSFLHTLQVVEAVTRISHYELSQERRRCRYYDTAIRPGVCPSRRWVPFVMRSSRGLTDCEPRQQRDFSTLLLYTRENAVFSSPRSLLYCLQAKDSQKMKRQPFSSTSRSFFKTRILLFDKWYIWC